MRLRRFGAHGDLRHVHVAVAHGDLGQALLGDVLAGRRELRDLADVGCLGCLAAGVGIHLGIEARTRSRPRRTPARGRVRRSRCRRPSRRRRRSRWISSRGNPCSRESCAASAAASPFAFRKLHELDNVGSGSVLRSRGVIARVEPRLRRGSRTLGSASGKQLLGLLDHHLARRRYDPAACRSRARRCPRTASSPKRGRDLPC